MKKIDLVLTAEPLMEARQEKYAKCCKTTLFGMYFYSYTPSVANYNSLDFCNPKFNHSPYSKKMCKHN